MTDEEFEVIWTDLVARVHGNDAKPLTRQESLFYAVNVLRGEVPSGGFIGYFENETGASITNAFDGLRELKLTSVLSLLEEAKEKVLGARDIPNDATLIEVFPESLPEEAYEEASDRLDQELKPIEERFFDCEDAIWQALCHYADEHLTQEDD